MIQIIVTRLREIILIIVSMVLFLIILPEKIHAQVVINEVSPISTPEWVEIYNIGENNISLKDYSINFGSEAQNLIFCDDAEIIAKSYKVIELSTNWLANTGDVVILKSGDDEIDKIGYGTGYSLPKPDSVSKSLTRSPDGSSNWVLSSQSSRQGDAISFSCPSPSPSPLATPGQTNFKAVYKINKSKDGNSTELNGVGIYVDGNYTHHEDDEIIEFFNGHECYSGVSCDLGMHTISMRKNGYISWEDTQNFTAGANFEVSPVLNKEDISTPIPTPIKTPTPKPTPTKTPKPSPGATPVDQENLSSVSGVLGIQSNITNSPTPFDTAENKKISFLPFILVFAGLCFIAIPIFSIIRNGQKGTETNKPLGSSDSMGGNDL